MTSAYARWVGRWEYRLATRDTDRVVRPFEWGLDWLGLAGTSDPAFGIRKYVAGALADSDAFFSYVTPSDYCLDQTHLTFTSPVVSPYPENNLGSRRILSMLARPGQGSARAPSMECG